MLLVQQKGMAKLVENGSFNTLYIVVGSMEFLKKNNSSYFVSIHYMLLVQYL